MKVSITLHCILACITLAFGSINVKQTELQSRLLDENELEQKEPKKKKKKKNKKKKKKKKCKKPNPPSKCPSKFFPAPTKAPTTAPTNSPIDLTILHMNDHHSHLEQEDFDLRGDDVPPSLTDVDRLRVHYGGFPRLVSLVKKIEEESTGNVLKFHAGDAITGTSFYSLFKGKADADMMNRICFDAVGLGNHEFDNGDQTLTDFLKVLTSQSDICDSTPVLAANLSPGDSSPLKQLVDDGIIMPSMIKTLTGGQKLGVIGINIKRKTEISSNPDEGTNFLDEKETTEAEIQKLKDLGASIIIVITHVGFSNDLDWIAEIDGVDVIIGGDSHTLLGNAQDLAIISEPTSSFPTIVQNGNKKVCVVQAWEYAHGLGKLQISFDENGNVVTCNGGMVFPFDGERFTVKTDPDDYDLTSEQASEVSAYLESLGSHLVATPKDLDTTSKLEEYSSQVDELAQMIIATVPEDICYERIPGQGRSTICTEEDTAAQGGGVCNIASKAFMDQVKTADVAINNAGGCRQDIFAGDFSIEDAYELLPFSNTLVVFDMTGDEIIELIEQSLEFALSPDGSSGAYPYASGLRFHVNATEPFGSRFSDVEVNSRVLGEWTAIDSSNVYAVATNSFIAAGRDGYILFGELSDEGKMLDTYLEYAQTFIDYSIDVGTLVDLPLEEYSTQSYFVSE